MCLFCMVACGIWESLVGRYFQTFLPWDTLVPSEPLGGATIIGNVLEFPIGYNLKIYFLLQLYLCSSHTPSY